MVDPVALEALILSAMTAAFPFYNWLVMLAAELAREESQRERVEKSLHRHREIVTEALTGQGFIGSAKPRNEAETNAGAFAPGF